jgi:hypothetical protein
MKVLNSLKIENLHLLNFLNEFNQTDYLNNYLNLAIMEVKMSVYNVDFSLGQVYFIRNLMYLHLEWYNLSLKNHYQFVNH